MAKARNRKFKAFVKILLLALASLLILNLVLKQQGQKTPGLPEQVQKLKLDSTQAGAPLFYSEGYLERGKWISILVENARVFYLDKLEVNVQARIALLDTADYQKISASAPYGLPFVSQGFIVLPADTSTGVVKSMFEPFEKTASREIISNLHHAGYTYAEAVNRMVDLIGLHELGHTVIFTYGMDTRQAWFSEFMASYLGYAYLKAEEPGLAVIWDNLTRAGFEGYTPRHTSLDVFNERYVGVGVGDYVWFQNAFQERIREVYASKGLDFFRLVHERLADPSFQPETAMALLEALEELEPGFIAWARAIQA